MENKGIYMPKRLANLFDRVIENKITFISAPAGYGKTTLATHWTQNSRIPSYWINVTDSFNNTDKLNNLIDSTLKKNKDHKITLIIDQFERLKDTTISQRLNESIRHAPNNVSFILLSRRSFGSFQFQSDFQNNIFLLQEDELKLNSEEMSYWLSIQTPGTLELSNQDKIDILTFTDGCPALLHLALHLYQQHENASLVDQIDRVAPAIEDYIINNWLSCLPKNILLNIHPLTIPPYLSIELASELKQTNVNDLFQTLENHLLLKKKCINGRWIHCFHPLVRAVINERYASLETSQKDLEHITLFLEKEDLFEEALKMSLKTENVPLMFNIMKKFAPKALQNENFSLIQQCFKRADSTNFTKDEEMESLSFWVEKGVDISDGKNIADHVLISDTVTDKWTPFISLNSGSVPFINTKFGIDGNINSIRDTYNSKMIPQDKEAFLPFRRLALAEALYEQNETKKARKTIEACWFDSGSEAHPGFAIPALWLELLCQQIAGNTKDVHFLAEEIFHRAQLTTIPVWKRIGEAVVTYVLIQEGHLYDAEDWISKQKQLVADEWNEWRGFEYFMFARGLIAVQDLEEAGNLLKRMVTSTSLEKNNRVYLKRRILQAIVAIKLNQQEEANFFIREALEMGCQYGYTRSFLDEDVLLFLPIQEIQHKLPQHLYVYSNRLIELANKESHNQFKINPRLKDALTLREIEIIKLIKSGMSNSMIGKQMNITEGTVKGHLYRIYKKLNVKNRTQAIKAAESGLLL